jgi:hypothetical protein
VIIDAQLHFANRQALSAGTTEGTDRIDRGPVAAGSLVSLDDFGLWLAIHSNAGTVQAVVEHSDDNSTFSTLIKTAAFSGTGEKKLELPPLSKRYLRVSFVSSGAANVSAGIAWLQ